jgi:hypothetical protein
VGKCHCADGWTGLDCDVDEDFRQAIETTKISPVVIAIAVIAAVILGVIGGVSIWKSWANRGTGAAGGAPVVSSMTAPPPRTTGAYSRLPRRLVK